jgi:O-methyltransferase
MPLKRLVAATRRAIKSRSAPGSAAIDFPLEEEQRLYDAHGRAPIERHLDILYGDFTIGGTRFVDVYRQAMHATGTVVTPFNVFQRFETRRQLCQYLFATLDIPGLRAECGVYRGATALLLCRALKSRSPEFDGTGMHLIDSFSGTSNAVAQDLIPVRESDGSARMHEFFTPGKTDTSAELVRGFFASEFPGATLNAGWIPAVFSSLPESHWAYVHIDVTLFEPTLAALEYFYPRLSPGGVILCDGSIFCPGAERAVRQYCERKALAYAVLGHREYVLMKDVT